MHEHHRYNGTDVLATRQVLDTLLPIAARRGVLELAKAELVMEAPLLAIAMRGVRVDEARAAAMKRELGEMVRERIAQAEAIAGCKLSGPKAFSTQKLTKFFFEELKLNGKRSTDETALGQIKGERRTTKLERGKAGAAKRQAAAVAAHVLEARGAGKLLGVIQARRHHGRLRGSFNIGATETHRLSSSSTPRGDGTNLQNIAGSIRSLFVPSGPEWMFVGLDQERAESRCVAWLSGDAAYMRAHEEGDTHCNVARLLWGLGPEVSDAELKENGLRQRAKAIQHAMNYLEPDCSPITVARMAGMSTARAQEMMDLYYEAFPGITDDKHRVAQEIAATGFVEVGDIRRHLHGRLGDSKTLREALSHRAQLLSTWTTNVLLARLWLELDGPDLRLLVHEHDGILMEVQRSTWPELRPQIEARTHIEWDLGERKLVLPWEIKTGESWAEV